MKVSELMSGQVEACRPEDALASAAQVLWEHDCGCVPVVDALGRVCGMLTDRDVAMAAYTTGRELSRVRVEHAMASDVRSCRPEDELADALATMAEAQVRRLPVVDGGRHLVGLLSLADVAQGLERARRGRRSMTDDLVSTLVAATRPRPSTPGAAAEEEREIVPPKPRARRTAGATGRKGDEASPKAAKRTGRKR